MASHKVAIIIVTFVYQLCLTSAQTCSSHTSCGECIRSSSGCAWCSTVGSARCLSTDHVHDGGCIASDIINPISEIVQENTLTLDDVNQVSLESVHLKLRVGQTQNVTFSVKAANNFPLDVYMVMDLSFSLRFALSTVQSVAEEIANSLSNVSSDFRIGFGSYVDKVVPPFTGRNAAELRYTHFDPPSACEINACVKPFAFEHNVGLTNITEDFTTPIAGLGISTNADNPEGTLDAMLQAVVCGEVIGWRETYASRKILLVITDATIHTAGDGWLAGILEPNDGQCHTEYDPTEDKILYDGTIQDYPSLHQLRNILREFEVVPVFAITQTNNMVSPRVTKFIRNQIAPFLEGSTIELTNNAKNIVDALKEAYDNVASQAGLTFTTPDYLLMSVDAECPGGPAFLVNDQCTQINDSTVNFTVSVTLNSCTNDLANGQNQTILITIPGFGEVSVMIEGHCSCSCESTPNSNLCSRNGQEVCGACECNEGWSGNLCDCSTAACPMGPNQVECSGRGECVCGECVCNSIDSPMFGVSNPMIIGDTCECSNFECGQGNNGVVCSGQGTCTCSNSVYNCVCNTSAITGEPHTGNECQCSADHCIAPGSIGNIICSGHGNCTACHPARQACSCDKPFGGSYCEELVSVTGHCSMVDSQCVYCVAESLPCDANCNKHSIITATTDSQVSIAETCYVTHNGCGYTYYSGYSNGSIVFEVESSTCRTTIMPLFVLYSLLGEFIIFLTVAAVIVVLGIKRLKSRMRARDNIPMRENEAYATVSRSTSDHEHFVNTMYEDITDYEYIKDSGRQVNMSATHFASDEDDAYEDCYSQITTH